MPASRHDPRYMPNSVNDDTVVGVRMREHGEQLPACRGGVPAIVLESDRQVERDGDHGDVHEDGEERRPQHREVVEPQDHASPEQRELVVAEALQADEPRQQNAHQQVA